MNEECVCPGLRLACREAFVLFGRALRWGICLKSVVVARLTCLCLNLFLCCWLFFLWFVGLVFVSVPWVGLGLVVWACGILVCVFLGQLQFVSARFSSSTWFVLLFGGEGRGRVLFDGRVRGCII